MKITPNLRLITQVLALISCISAAEVSHAAQTTQSTLPNIILIMCDDLGWGDTGFNGNDIIQTPNLDAMAANGVRFTRFYAASAVCSPTRGSVMTGRNPIRIGVPNANAGHLRESEKTIAEHLKSLNYSTGHFGKWHLGTFTKSELDSNRGGKPANHKHFTQPDDHGYDTYFATEAKVPTHDPMIKPRNHPARLWWDPVTDDKMAVPYRTAYWSPEGKVTDNLKGANCRVIMDRVLPFIDRAHSKNSPFFTTIWFHTPHLPVVAGPEFTSLYPSFTKYEQHYFGCITAMDHQIGRLRNHLASINADENTMIWFCSDNGPEGKSGFAPGSAGPFRGRKRDLYEGGIRVPALLEWPAKFKTAQSTDLPSFTSDYLPTILEWVGIHFNNAKSPLDGISLAAYLENGNQYRPVPMAFDYNNQTALIQHRFKLHVQKKSRDISLFDLIADPGETTDISSQYPFLAAHMHSQLSSWAEACLKEADVEK